MLISQPRRGVFEDFKGLKSSSGPVLGDRITIRNFLTPSTPFGGYKDTHSLDIDRTISGRRPFFKNCQTWPIGYYGTHRNFVRNILPSTTPFGGQKDTHSLDIVRAISGWRSFNKSCHTWSMEHYETLWNSIRNLLTLTTPFEGYKDTHIPDKVRAI